MRHPLLLCIPALATACLGRPLIDLPEDDGGSTGRPDGATTLPPISTTAVSTTADPDGGPSSGVDTDTPSDSSSSTGGLGEGEPCNLEGLDECAPGLKCMPYSSDASNWPNAAACFPIDPDAVDLYEPCVWHDHPWSGYDNCGDHAFCEDFDADGTGECMGLCIWNSENSNDFSCEDPVAEGNWGCQECFCMCQVSCNPLDPDCAEGESCVPNHNPAFMCAPDASGELGAHGDPCEFINVCDPGLACVEPMRLPGGCGEQSFGCCSTFCDTSQPNTCPGAAMGEICEPWFAPGEAPDGLQNVGICSLPI